MNYRPPCPEWRERLALRFDDLSPRDQLAMMMHVQRCEACASAQIDYRFFEARLDAMLPPTIKPRPRLALAATEPAEPELAQNPASPASSTLFGRRQPQLSAQKTRREETRRAGVVRNMLAASVLICLLLV